MKTVLAHGCFDLLHQGHIEHLKAARALGDRLVVSVTSDRFVMKGPGRPLYTERQRAETLLELRCVDEVKINDAPDAVPMIQHVKPSFYVKGIDYAEVGDDASLAREGEAVSALGGEMTFTSTKKWSSTQLMQMQLQNAKIKELMPFARYLDVLRDVECDMSFNAVLEILIRVRANRHHRLFFIGNGGSAAIASHMAADWQKAGKTPAMCFNEAAAITAIANDDEYAEVFREQIRWHIRDGDVLFAISSSGESNNIHCAVGLAEDMGAKVITLSGFQPHNNLRKLGVANFYVPSDRYGVVEAAHLVILHSLLDAAVEALSD